MDKPPPHRFQAGNTFGVDHSYRSLIGKVGAEIVESEVYGRISNKEMVVRAAFALASKPSRHSIMAAKFLAEHYDGIKATVAIVDAANVGSYDLTALTFDQLRQLEAVAKVLQALPKLQPALEAGD